MGDTYSNKRKAERSRSTRNNGKNQTLPPRTRLPSADPVSDSDLFAPDVITPDNEDGPTISSDILAIRIEIANWSFNWGPESVWETRFHEDLAAFKGQGREAVDRFLRECKEHAHDGREILKDLKFAGNAGMDSTYEEIRDLFLQGFEMVVAVTSEVKFCEMTLDHYAPAGPASRLSNIRTYYSDST